MTPLLGRRQWELVQRRDANRVIRGGAFNSHPTNVRAAYRNGNHPGNRWHNVGFRPVSSPESSDDAQWNRRRTCPSSDGEYDTAGALVGERMLASATEPSRALE